MKKIMVMMFVLIGVAMTVFTLPAAAEQSSWSTAYREFVLNDGFKTTEETYDSTDDYAWVKFGLYDLDRDGVFEMVAHSGTGKMKYVYTFENNSVKCLGQLIYERPCRYLPDSPYTGLFNFGGDTGMYSSTYVTMENGSCHVEDIYGVLYRMNDTTHYQETSDEELYQIAIGVCEESQGEELSVYTIEEINSMGWEAFIGKYLSAPEIKAQPDASADDNGEDVEISIEASGTNLSYEWEYSDDNGSQWTPTDDAEPVLTISKDDAVEGRLYRCTVTNEAGSATSDPIKIPAELSASSEVSEPNEESVGLDKQAILWIAAAAAFVFLLLLLFLILWSRGKKRSKSEKMDSNLKTDELLRVQPKSGSKFCGRCGTPRKGDEAFCTNCGNPLTK